MDFWSWEYGILNFIKNYACSIVHASAVTGSHAKL
jgi:hypothetical protein